MANKVLTSDSVLNEADLDGDGIVSNDELNKHERILRIENEDKKKMLNANGLVRTFSVCYFILLQSYLQLGWAYQEPLISLEIWHLPILYQLLP